MSLKSRLPEIIAELPIAARAAALAGAEKVAESAKNRVPVGDGELQKAIHVDEQAEGAYVIAGDKETWYGHIVEHGSVKMAPRPFLVPALEENRAVIEATVAAALRRTVG